MKHERRLHSTWWILWITTHIIFSFIVIFFTPPVVSLHLGPEIFTTTLVANTVNVTVVHIDVERNILYFGAGAEYGGYVGRVVLGVDCGPTPLTFQIVAGVQGKLGSQDGVGSNALFGDVHGMDGTADGKTLYCSDHVNGLIRRINISRAGGGVGATFNVTTIAGSTPGYRDGTGRQALLRPIGVALNQAETALYIGDYGNSAIRRINLSTLLVETVVKIGISFPTFLRVSPDGAFVFFADSGNNRIARVASAPVSTLVNIAGVVPNGQTVVRDGVDGSSARFWEPRGLIFSPDKSILFVGNCFGNVIQAVRMDSGDYATVTIAGNATAGFTQSSASGSRAFMSIPVATFSGIQGLTLWQPPMQPVLSKNPSWVVIAGDIENGAIRCVSGPGLSRPFPPMAFKAQGTVRSVVSGSSLGAISDAYIHPVTGALYTNDGLTMVVRYDLDNRSGEFLQPLVVVAGGAGGGYNNGPATSATFSSICGFAGDGAHMMYVTESYSSFRVRSINITSLWVDTVAGNGVNTSIDGVGTNASLQAPLGMSYHPLKHILYVGGITTSIRKIDLATLNVTTLRLNTDVIMPHFLRLTPSFDTLFVSIYKSHTVIAIDTVTEALINVVAGAPRSAGSSDGFGSSARFTQPEGIALVGTDDGWPCLYVNEENPEKPGFIREIRLRDQYVRTISLSGLPAGFDIESIISYTNRTSGEYGLLLVNFSPTGRIFFLPIGLLPALTASASNHWTSSQSTSGPTSISKSHSPASSASCSHLGTNSTSRTISSSKLISSRSTSFSLSGQASTRSRSQALSTTHSVVTVIPSLSSTMMSHSSGTPTIQQSTTMASETLSRPSTSLTPSMCQCFPDTVHISLTAPAAGEGGVCAACQTNGVIVVLGGGADHHNVALYSRVDDGRTPQIQAAPISRATLLQLPSAPVLITIAVNGSNCWYATTNDVIVIGGLNTSLRTTTKISAITTGDGTNIGGEDASFLSRMEFLASPLADDEGSSSSWLSMLDAGNILFQDSSLIFHVTLRCSASSAIDDSNVTTAPTSLRWPVLVTLPCPGLPRAFASEVSTGITTLQWFSAVSGGPGASGAMGRLTVIRGLELCNADGGLSGLMSINLSSCGDDANGSLGGLLGNVVIIVSAILLLLVLCWLLAPIHHVTTSPRSLRMTMIAGARNTEFPSTLLPLATTLLPTTAALMIVSFDNIAISSSSGGGGTCHVSVTIICSLIALTFCVIVIGGTLAVHWAASSRLALIAATKNHEEINSAPKNAVKGTTVKGTTGLWSKSSHLLRTQLAQRYQWHCDDDDHKKGDAVLLLHHFAVPLKEFRLLWYCTFDLVTLAVVGILAGVAKIFQDSTVCAGCGAATSALYLLQFWVCVKSRPFMSTFGNVYAALTLALSTTSAALQTAQLIVQVTSSPLAVVTLQRLMLGSTVCNLFVLGISCVRLLIDLHELAITMIRKVKERFGYQTKKDLLEEKNTIPLGKNDERATLVHNGSESLLLPLQQMHDGNDDSSMLRTNGSGVPPPPPQGVGDLDEVDILGLFWDASGNAVVVPDEMMMVMEETQQQLDMFANNDATDLMSMNVHHSYGLEEEGIPLCVHAPSPL